MKKLILGLILSCFVSVVHAVDPTSVSIGSQIQAFLLTEGQAATEFTTTGKSKLEILDGLVGIGRYKANGSAPYWAVIDAGIIQNSEATNSIGASVGIHANIAQFVGSYMTLSPSAAAFWSYLNLTPRVSWDSDTHGHAVAGVTAGLSIPFN